MKAKQESSPFFKKRTKKLLSVESVTAGINPRRRDILAGMLAIVALRSASPPRLLFLHSYGLHSDLSSFWQSHQVSVLSRNGYAAICNLLRQATGLRLIALLNDADALVIETLLARQGVAHRATRPAGTAAVLLTASL